SMPVGQTDTQRKQSTQSPVPGVPAGPRALAAPPVVADHQRVAVRPIVAGTTGERGVLRVPGLGGALQFALQRSRALPPSTRALLLGVATPLLPCGLLWSACAVATR